jgi:hypothetical protein
MCMHTQSGWDILKYCAGHPALLTYTCRYYWIIRRHFETGSSQGAECWVWGFLAWFTSPSRLYCDVGSRFPRNIRNHVPDHAETLSRRFRGFRDADYWAWGFLGCVSTLPTECVTVLPTGCVTTLPMGSVTTLPTSSLTVDAAGFSETLITTFHSARYDF